ncbi:hypothetical protein [Xenorhabdus indica]|uniref:hypothetical protein n=1 Tax=Xenorhabdus indica TaxID=333964 RepID=UPI001656A114|nr:hypothetical protein [Xenorhabdus indica]MBC8947279.1 hypothetical protein [Xenorhabdus indica]MBC8947302.1 hypothetical protein [Xenorhabdus indica]
MSKPAFILLIGFLLLVSNSMFAFFYSIVNWQWPTWGDAIFLLKLTFSQLCAFTVMYLAVNALFDWAKVGK